MRGEGDFIDYSAKVLAIDVFQIAVKQACAERFIKTVGATGKTEVITDTADAVTGEVLIV
ncbi:hypothetical protein D3C86_1821860 [compost metagenome]